MGSMPDDSNDDEDKDEGKDEDNDEGKDEGKYEEQWEGSSLLGGRSAPAPCVFWGNG